MLIVLQIFQNILLLSLMGLAYYYVERNRRTLGEFNSDVLNGLGLGFIAFFVTTTPVMLGDGATIDARAGPTILAGVIAGPVGGLIAASFGTVARGIVGGSFAASAMIIYFVYALIGVAIRRLRIVNTASVAKPRSVGILVVASFAGASTALALIRPASRAIEWAQNDLPYIFFANTLSVTYAAIIIGVANTFLKKTADLYETNQALNLAKRAGRFGIWDYDLATDKLLWDERSKELHGADIAVPEHTMEDWSKNVHPDDLEATRKAFERALSNDEVFDSEYRVLLPDGRQKYIKGDAIVIRDDKGKAVRVVGSNIDLTDIRNAEAKLAEARALAAQTQKLDTIGQLTGGVAHDFNNLLAVILGNLELLKHDLHANPPDPANADPLIDASIEATRRGAELTQNMLAYARKASLKPVAVDLNAVVQETAQWIRRTIKSSIEIEVIRQRDLWPTLTDRGSLQSALVNLLVNARDAYEGPGRVTIETRNVDVTQEDLDSYNDDIVPGRYVMLSVTDNGAGMSSQILAKIFDPFFTTKPVGKGTGMGLSMVQGFVKQSQGTIQVTSEVGQGTCFELYFPAAPNAQVAGEPASPKALTSERSGQHRGRILLVEDREDVANVLRQILEGAGFQVITAASGDEAFSYFSKDDDFELIVTDIVMPGALQGPSLANEIRKTRPDMRFVFVSGYASDETEQMPGIGSGDPRLMKPISRADLLQAIDSQLVN